MSFIDNIFKQEKYISLSLISVHKKTIEKNGLRINKDSYKCY